LKARTLRTARTLKTMNKTMNKTMSTTMSTTRNTTMTMNYPMMSYSLKIPERNLWTVLLG